MTTLGARHDGETLLLGFLAGGDDGTRADWIDGDRFLDEAMLARGDARDKNNNKLLFTHFPTTSKNLLSLRLQVFHPSTRINVGLLGPCYKTGLMKTFNLRV
jgi:hypothetical protein